ncbi:phenylacetate--CoA ligase family protein [Legionella shakespearei]|nr:phenylacetate--CoA ligase family protein [Legionella shakespearei]
MKNLFPISMRSTIPGIVWPEIISPMAAQLYYQLAHFDVTEKLPEANIKEFQFRQLTTLFNFARQFVPYYQEKFAHLPFISDWHDLANLWEELPILTRTDIQQADSALFAEKVPPGHEPSELLSTSGSTGHPVTIKGNVATQFFWNAISLRNHLWHKDEFNKSFATIRYGFYETAKDNPAAPPQGTSYQHWSPATYAFGETGTCYHLSFCSVEEEAEWLLRVNPDYLNCNPSTLKAIIGYFAQHGKKPDKLKKVHTHSEIVEPSLRTLVKEILGISLIDNYSAKETGYIALQCPESDHYHIQSENILVEILNDQGKPCAVNEPGKVIVTPLHNFSSPLIRYQIGDYAIPGEPCVCGRTLPILKQVLGRQRNMLHLPDGRQVWPSFANNGVRLMDLFSNRQFQVVQKSLMELEVNLTGKHFTSLEEDQLREKLMMIFEHPFNFIFNYVNEIPRSTGGKFEDFKSEC